jgi:hypothetical protein
MTSALPFRLALVLLVLLAGLILYAVALQSSGTMRFEIGSMDWDFLGDPEDFEGRSRMDGPIRYPDGSVEVIQFYGRVTREKASFRLPYHATRSPLRLRIRCHRFGLEGVVELSVNGRILHEFVFTDTSYPWGGIEAVVPQSLAETGPLVIELRTFRGRTPPSHLPEDVGLGVDWIEVEPLSRGVRIVPSAWRIFLVTLSLLLCLGFLMATGASFPTALSGAAILAAAIALHVHLAPVATGMAIGRLWVIFPMGYALWRMLRRAPLADAQRVFLARMFALALLAHSILIFFPNHLPPDVGNHLPQVEWLGSLNFTFDELYRFSSSSDPFDDGHVRPHFGVEYGAPYPPIFYLITYAITFVHGDIRFLIEFLAVAVSAAMMVPVFLLARTIWKDERVARFAVVLLALEISIWHHAHRVHAPGSLGELCVLFWLYFLAAHGDVLSSGRGLLSFAAGTMITALSYPASLVQISIFSAFMAVFLWRAEGEELPRLRRFSAGLAIGFAGAFLLYYAPYAIQALQKSALLLDRQVYDPPATFLLLRNQMRDTVRILRNGYPLYVGLSLAGLVLLPRSGISSYHKKILVACGLTYAAMLTLKDPALLPMVFLHAKEDLFYAPVACLLSGLVLAWLWDRARPARALVILFLVAAALLQLRDQALNRDTLYDQPHASIGQGRYALGARESRSVSSSARDRAIRSSAPPSESRPRPGRASFSRARSSG